MTGRFSGALVDVDGTVVRGGSLLPGADEALRRLREAGIDLLFLTNNPTRTPADVAAHLRDLGVEASPEEVLTSMDATLEYLRDHHADEPILPVAGEPVLDQLRADGVDLVSDPAAASVVLAGYDAEFDYADVTAGLRALLDGATLVGTDPDRWVPTDDGPIPGSGAIVNAVGGAARTEPEAILGKPSEETAELALDRLGVPAGGCLVVGDRLDTDVAMGEQVGATTVLVLTGAAEAADVATAASAPDHVLDSLADVGRLLNR